MEKVKKIEQLNADNLVMFYHVHQSPVPFSELRGLYRNCVISDAFAKYEIVPDQARALITSGRKGNLAYEFLQVAFELPCIAVERDGGEHYLPFEDSIRESILGASLGLFGYVVSYQIARYFGVESSKYGIFPCDFGICPEEMRVIFNYDLEEYIPANILLYSDDIELYNCAEERGFPFLDVRFGDEEIFAAIIPFAEAAAMCYASKSELLNYLHEAACGAQELEYQLAQL